MSKFYLATVAAVVVTTSLASNLLVVGTRRPVQTGIPARLRSASRRWSRRLKHIVDAAVAAMLAYRERQATLWALHRMSDRELQDIGVDRGNIGTVARDAKPRPHLAAVRERQ
jgi:uncharacterized protein YjiS (DUF1127 family)